MIICGERAAKIAKPLAFGMFGKPTLSSATP